MSENAVRWSGMAAIIAGVLWLADLLIESVASGYSILGLRLTPILEVVKWPMMIAAYFGFRSAQRGRDGGLGRAGMVIGVFGGIVLTISWGILLVQESIRGLVEEGTGILDPIGIFSSIAGLALIGIAAARARVLPM